MVEYVEVAIWPSLAWAMKATKMLKKFGHFWQKFSWQSPIENGQGDKNVSLTPIRVLIMIDKCLLFHLINKIDLGFMILEMEFERIFGNLKEVKTSNNNIWLPV